MGLVLATSLGETIITVTAGLVGVGLGGLISGYVALRSERAREEFERARERRAAEQDSARDRAAALGVARVMYAHFSDAQLFLRTAADRRDWWPESERLGIEASQEDRKALASLLSPSARSEVVRVDFAAFAAVDRGQAWSSQDGLGSSAQVRDQRVGTAAESLSSFSDKPGSSRPPRLDPPTSQTRPSTERGVLLGDEQKR